VLARLTVCASIALVAIPAAAQAAEEPPRIPAPASDQQLATAHSLAVARWATEPCGGQVTTSWAHMGAGINARSQWMSIDVKDPSTYSDCAITYNLDVDWDWPKLCTVVEHELGHLAGHGHVDDPHDVMSPYYVFPSPECAAAARQAAPAKLHSAPRSAASSRRASSARRKAKKRKAAAAVKGRPAKKRDGSKKRKKNARSAAASLSAPRFGCVLVSAR
jgi:hypothetical protein